jgi:gliding motility-associated-like protein
MYYLEVRGPGCSIFDSILVKNEVLDNKFTLSDTSGCSPLTINFNNLSSNYDSLIWSFGNQTLSNVEMPTYTFNNIGTYSVGLKTINKLCNTNINKTLQIEVFQSIKIDPINDTSACSGEGLTLQINDYNTANKFHWSTDSKFSDTLSTSRTLTLRNINTAKRYYISISNNHCDTTVSFMVTMPVLNINLLDSIKKCSNDTIEINATTGNSSSSLIYTWSPSTNIIGSTSSNKIRTNTNTDITYYLDVTNKLGCHYTDSVFLKVTKPIVDQLYPFTINDSVPFGKEIYLQSDIIKESFNYQWTPEKLVDSPNLPITRTVANTDTLYQLFVFDEASGCSYKGRLRISVYDDECTAPHIFVPSAFTPNNDFSNDVLFVRGELIETFNFQVFNRWGELVFESNDLSIGWNGNYKGVAAQEGVYVFQLEAKCYNGQEYFLKGDVTLIR